jgi:hypothetical protein
LNHPNIAAVYDVGSDGDTRPPCERAAARREPNHRRAELARSARPRALRMAARRSLIHLSI